MKTTRKKLSVWQLLALLYLGGTLMGSILLILPFATKSGQETSYLNALFTAASAVCITGLTPYDIAVHWTLFGQLVILLLVQMSGLGFMTLVSSVFLIFGRSMSMGNRNALMMDSRGERAGLKKLLYRILAGTAICETAGALLLMISFIPDFGAGKGIYFSIWHSVSAFCNAGFDLLGSAEGGTFVSLTGYATDPVVTLTISALIILGGIGFCVWGDIIDCKLKFKKYQLNTKVVLIVSATLIVLGTALFMLFERNNPTYADYNFGEKLLVSFFNSVTPRTAGFASTDSSSLSNSGFLLTVVLMFIGGGSGSTAGGIKVGTFTVLVMGMLSAFRGKKDIIIGKRRIPYTSLSEAFAILTACLAILILAILAICSLQPALTFEGVLFECVSAVSNTGLTQSLTTRLNAGSSIIIIFLMYAGRVGILTLALALGKTKTTAEIRRPIDNLLIG